VVPPALVEPFVGELATIDPGASPVQQRALGRFLADGLMDRHLGRVRRSLHDRQDAMLGAIQRDLGWLVSARPVAGGTRLIASIEDPAWSSHDVAAVAAEAGVAMEPLASARVASAPDRELVIDYGRHEPLELQAAVRVIGKALRAQGLAGRRRAGGLSTLGAGA
jgi:GntR family transcriptional regulator / MocR family aminotransferase